RSGQAVRRVEIAQALHLVLSRPGNIPRGGDQQNPGRPGACDAAATDAVGGAVQRAWRNLHNGGRRAPQERLARRDACPVNPLLGKLQPYPFEKLRALIAGNTPPATLPPINLQIGEPKHPTPALVKEALAGALEGLAAYPLTAGSPELRQAIAAWLSRRYGIPPL